MTQKEEKEFLIGEFLLITNLTNFANKTVNRVLLL